MGVPSWDFERRRVHPQMAGRIGQGRGEVDLIIHEKSMPAAHSMSESSSSPGGEAKNWGPGGALLTPE